MLCFVVVMQSFIMNSHEVFIHIHQGCFAGTGAIVRLPQCQWSKPDGYGKISQCITTTKHSKAKTVCIFLGIYCITSALYQHMHCFANEWCCLHAWHSAWKLLALGFRSKYVYKNRNKDGKERKIAFSVYEHCFRYHNNRVGIFIQLLS